MKAVILIAALTLFTNIDSVLCSMDGMPMLSWPYEWFNYVHSWIDAIFDFMSHPDGDSENIFIIKIGAASGASTNSYKENQSSNKWNQTYTINNNKNPKEIRVFNPPTVEVDVIKPDALSQYNITSYTRENYFLDLKNFNGTLIMMRPIDFRD